MKGRLPEKEPAHLVEVIALVVVICAVPLSLGAALLYLLVGG